MQGLLGKKIGMTRVFDDQGRQIPVTVVEVGPCVVLQRKTKAIDGYEAIQVGFADQKPSRVGRAALARFQKANVAPKRWVREFLLEEGDEYKVGDTITVSVFEKVPYVDVTGMTKGRGFQGVVRRHRMAGGPMTHGGHSKRRPGSIGCRTFPARVHRGKRMPGHMGDVRATIQNLKVVGLRGEDNLMLIHGAIPGATGGVLMIRKSIKRPAKAS